MAQIADFVREHLAGVLDVNSLATAAGFSRSHFGRLFKQQFGCSPHTYVARCRVERAGFLLATTNKKEIEIATLCGFTDETLLARWFRRLKGCAPSDVRLRHYAPPVARVALAS